LWRGRVTAGKFPQRPRRRPEGPQQGEDDLQALLALSGLIDRINRAVAALAAFLVLASCMISAGNAAMRYLFSISSNAWLEIQWQMFAGVDLLHAMYSPRGRLWLDILGILFFLLPATLLIAWMGWGFFMTAFTSGETSSNAGGLVLWPVKLLMPAGFLLLALQGISELIKRVAALRGIRALDLAYEKPLQ
jgi:TRAP-type mannitol/chloroaromatic compound transport system permease small subunit